MSERKLTQEEKDIVIKAYIKAYLGQVACGKKIGADTRIVKRILKEANITIRSFSEAAVVSNQNRRKYFINEEYFDTESPNMAYILGFLAAEGSVSKRDNSITIGLSLKDKDFLQSLLNEMDATYKIKEYVSSNGYDCCKVAFTSKKIKDKLSEYNIIPAKTFTFKFPKQLNKEYWIDFIRGYFDGNGSVSTAGNHAIRWQLCSATKDVLETIVQFFFEKYNISKTSILKQPRANHILYYIQYSSAPTRQIYHVLYTPNSLYLPRKKEKFEQIL